MGALKRDLADLESVSVVTASSKKRAAEEDSVLPVGWIELTDQFREVDDASTDMMEAETAFDEVVPLWLLGRPEHWLYHWRGRWVALS